MSYILDALRRADAERERDPARGIHAQPVTAPPVNAGAATQRWTWGAAVAGLGAVAAFVAWSQAAAPLPPAASTPVVLRPAAEVATPAPVVVPVAAAVSPPAPAALPRPVEAAEPPVRKAAIAAAPAAAPPASAAPVADRILAVAELPADVQRELPKLAISGGVHSENAAQRLLIVGGQVVNEGAELAPGVVLEQIRARNAVLRFRGYRYSVGF